MDGMVAINQFLDRTGKDARIGPIHIALFTVILKCYLEQKKSSTIILVSTDIMRMAKICSSATYHKVIRELNDFGYISYQPTKSRWEKSRVSLVSY